MASRLWLLLAVLVPNIIVDQLTKQMAVAWLKGRPGHRFLGDSVRLIYAENPGAFLSLGGSMSTVGRLAMYGVSLVLVVGVLVYALRTPSMTRLQLAGTACLAGGGLSNLLDRFFRDGARVVDFVQLGLGPVSTGVFNVADIAILVGVGALLWGSRAQTTTDSSAAARN